MNDSSARCWLLRDASPTWIAHNAKAVVAFQLVLPILPTIGDHHRFKLFCEASTISAVVAGYIGVQIGIRKLRTEVAFSRQLDWMVDAHTRLGEVAEFCRVAGWAYQREDPKAAFEAGTAALNAHKTIRNLAYTSLLFTTPKVGRMFKDLVVTLSANDEFDHLLAQLEQGNRRDAAWKIGEYWLGRSSALSEVAWELAYEVRAHLALVGPSRLERAWMGHLQRSRTGIERTSNSLKP